MLISMGMNTGAAAKSPWDGDYSQEVMHVEWNPVVASLQEAAAEIAGQVAKRHTMPASMAEMDVGAFLREMYAAQR